jgi:hypothetical protein
MAETSSPDPQTIIAESIETLTRRGGASFWLLDLLRSGDIRDPADVLLDLEFAVELFTQKFDASISAIESKTKRA